MGQRDLTTIVLISIGIMLASFAALMTMHYGGAAYNDGEVKAKALVLENAAQNVATAMAGRRFAGARMMPASLGDLRSGGSGSTWMRELPDIGASGGGPAQTRQDGDALLYVVLSISDEVCRRVNRDYAGMAVPTPTARSATPRGCYGTQGSGFVFYSVLGDAPSV